MEKQYQFKEKLINFHKPTRDYNAIKGANEIELKDGLVIEYGGSDKVILTAIDDFILYLKVAMNIRAKRAVRKNGEQYLYITLDKNIKEKGYMGYSVSFKNNGIVIAGFDNKGAMQGLYFLEDTMNLRHAPFLLKKKVDKKAVFSPRFSQSPLGMGEYDKYCFNIFSHYGFDAVDLWISGYNRAKNGKKININSICDEAEKYGIDVYIKLYAHHKMHPQDENAEAFYDELYGSILSRCKKIKGLILLGEATHFPSRDKRVGVAPLSANFEDNIPTGKTSPGWFPCNDYPEWVALIQKVARKYIPDINVILSTYNWGFNDEKDRVALINGLPNGVSVLATWDMFEQFDTYGVKEDIVDYSLRFQGPGKYFISEALASKKRNLNMYAISNTSGRTWDFGVVPFEPMPYQWIKRFNNVVKAHDELGLKGLYENIHYAFQPSIINDLAKQAFFTNGKNLTEYLDLLIERDYGKENLVNVKRAFMLWSKAITYYIPTNEDQYGAFRIGPSYPLWMTDPKQKLIPYPEDGKMSSDKDAMFGNSIYFSYYTPDIAGRNSLTGVRIYAEIKSNKKMLELIDKGLVLLEPSAKKNEQLFLLYNLGEFIKRTVITAIHVKELYINMQKISIIGSKKKAEELLDKAEKILLAERDNVEKTVPIVQADSRIGFEPSMCYACDEKALRWKLKQLDYELNFTLKNFRKSNSL